MDEMISDSNPVRWLHWVFQTGNMHRLGDRRFSLHEQFAKEKRDNFNRCDHTSLSFVPSEQDKSPMIADRLQ
jgi:hypothetical protein